MNSDEEEEEEPLALDYTRSHGLCIDYTVELSQLRIGDSDIPSDDTIDQDLRGPFDSSTTDAVARLARERLAVNRDAAALLKSVLALRDAPVCELVVEDGRKRILDWKQELPILRTDVELDLQGFGNVDVLDLRDSRIPSESVNEDEDEGFEWPDKYLAYPGRCDALAGAERLAVSRHVLVYLQDAIRDTYTLEDSERIKAEGLGFKLVGCDGSVGNTSLNMKSTAVRPLTPPLLPLSPLISPYIPSSPANHLELAPESSDGVSAEARAFEHNIMAADSLCRKSSDSSDSMLLDITHPPQFSPLFEDRKSPVLKRRAEDLRIEGPLTPPTFSDSPLKKLKSVSFSEILQETCPFEPWSDHNDDESSAPKGNLAELVNVLGPAAKEVKKRLDNERLSEADTNGRVDVPEIDFTLPIAPWNEYCQIKNGKCRPGGTDLDAQMEFLLKVKREDMKSVASWHGLSALSRELPWNFFIEKVSNISIEEKLYGETELNKMLADLSTGTIASSSTEVWKRDGLRILDDVDDDEEELEPAEVDGGRDIEALVRKRKLEIEEEAVETNHKRAGTGVVAHDLRMQVHESRHRASGSPMHRISLDGHSKTLDPHQQSPQASLDRRETIKPPKVASEALMFGEFSATTALHKFMATQGKTVEIAGRVAEEKLPTKEFSTQSGGMPSHYAKEVVSDRALLTNPQKKISLGDNSYEQSKSGIGVRDQTNYCSTPPLPSLPFIPDHLPPCSFIVSSKLLQQRSLTKQIEHIYPAAELVYRDYNLPHSAAQEADIVLSPSTGLIFTTLQQVKQQALPGQPNRSPIKERMSDLQLRYERLIVVVSEGLSREMEQFGSGRPEDARDKEVLSVLEKFAINLEGEVVVEYVRGGEQALARSIVAGMARYGLPHGSKDIADIKPLDTETNVSLYWTLMKLL